VGVFLDQDAGGGHGRVVPPGSSAASAVPAPAAPSATTVTRPGAGSAGRAAPGWPAPECRPAPPGWALNLNGLDFENARPTERPKAGTVEDWLFINMTGDTHPMHTHLVTHTTSRERASSTMLCVRRALPMPASPSMASADAHPLLSWRTAAAARADSASRPTSPPRTSSSLPMPKASPGQPGVSPGKGDGCHHEYHAWLARTQHRQVRTRLLRLASGPPVCGTVPGDSQWVP